MDIPKTIKIGGHLYSCKVESNFCRDGMGLGNSCGNALTIKIDDSVLVQNQESTLLHEILEQIDYRYELRLEHRDITILETALYQVIKDNPGIFRSMTENTGQEPKEEEPDAQK